MPGYLTVLSLRLCNAHTSLYRGDFPNGLGTKSVELSDAAHSDGRVRIVRVLYPAVQNVNPVVFSPGSKLVLGALGITVAS